MTKLHILTEDNHIIVLEKPVNVPVQEDSSGDLDLLTMVKDYIGEKYQKPGNVYIGLVHRLDRPVGGIMVFARTSKAASRLSESVRNRTFQKKYLAIVHGILPEKEGTMVDFLFKQENGTTIIDPKRGKESELTYQVLQEKEHLSLVQINLKTGRHHQIRIQFASRGYPLYGDNRYGQKESVPLCLFAFYLSFPHPTTKEQPEFSLPLPQKQIWSIFDDDIHVKKV